MDIRTLLSLQSWTVVSIYNHGLLWEQFKQGREQLLCKVPWVFLSHALQIW